MKERKDIETNASTEQKIKEAARVVFTRKGYAATRTRDIAEESGFNLALINYYFRSKEKLFDIIMLEAIQTFISSINGILNDQATTLQEKIEILIDHYIDMLIENPDLPIFILNGVNANPQMMVEKLGFTQKREDLYIVKQFGEFVASGKLKGVNPIHMILNLISMTVFPFVGSPMVKNRFGLATEEYTGLMIERKKLIPAWVNLILNNPLG